MQQPLNCFIIAEEASPSPSWKSVCKHNCRGRRSRHHQSQSASTLPHPSTQLVPHLGVSRLHIPLPVTDFCISLSRNQQKLTVVNLTRMAIYCKDPGWLQTVGMAGVLNLENKIKEAAHQRHSKFLWQPRAGEDHRNTTTEQMPQL